MPKPRPEPARAPAPVPLLRALPGPVVAICRRLEAAGIAAWLQGETLLDAWLGPTRARPPAHAIVCGASLETLLSALPTAVVTAEDGRRLTQASEAGPIDLIPTAGRRLDDVLLDFGLAPLAVAVRPSEGTWADPDGVGELLAKHELPRLPSRQGAADPFATAPRRFWLAALLIAEYALEPSPALIADARAALPSVAARLPEGAPARRTLDRILACPSPARALAFLRETGASDVILPGLDPAAECRIDALPPLASLRWAVYLRGASNLRGVSNLRGASTARALARLRMPHALARRIGRLHELHPLDRSLSGGREAPLRRAIQRLTPEELDGLIAWRKQELASLRTAGGAPREDAALALDRLARIEAAIERLRAQEHTTRSRRQLALGGRDVMRILGTGAGPQVGRALAYLARVIAEDPTHNTAAGLEAALRAWQASAHERGE